MRYGMRMTGILCALMMASFAALAQGDDTRWLGIWQSKLDGQPGAILTLADDNGALEGTLVLNIVVHDGGEAHIAAHETHALMHAKLTGNSLTFDVKQIDRSGRIVSFTADLTDQATATLHCTTCGDAPVVEMTREP